MASLEAVAMSILIILPLFLDLRVARGFNYPSFATENSHGIEVVVMNDLETDKCSKVVQPLCATNGQDFLYFQNKCQMEVKNYELLLQGLLEYNECPLKFCMANCPTCAFIHEPVCAVELLTGAKKIFDNPCEMERTVCTTKRVWSVVPLKECIMGKLKRVLKPLNLMKRKPSCPMFCPFDYRPVCARFMNQEKEFRNECELEAVVCRTQQTWHIINQGPCLTTNQISAQVVRKCPTICPHEYKPICAEFQHEMSVFGNRCELDKIICHFGQNWQVVKEGQCPLDYSSLPHRECPKFCLDQHEPVCAEFGGEHKEFENLCELLKAKCKSKTNWQIVNLGSCAISSQQLLLLASNCPQTCAQLYKPVCAKFKGKLKQFRNSCELQKAVCETKKDWELLHKGPCHVQQYKKPVKNSCEHEILDPVCGVYDNRMKTFDNVCQLASEIERSGNVWAILHRGRCNDTASSTAACLDEKSSTNSVTKGASNTNLRSSSTTAQTTTSKKNKYSSKNYNKIAEKEADEVCEEKDDTYYDNYDYGLGSSEARSSSLKSDDCETLRNWEEAQISSLHSTEDQSVENYTEIRQLYDKTTSKAFVKRKNSTFNYEQYSQEDEASEEIQTQENHTTTKTYLNNAVAKSLTKASGNLSGKYEAHERKSIEEGKPQNNARHSEEKKQYGHIKTLKRKETVFYGNSKAKANNLTTYEEADSNSTSTSADKNPTKTYLYEDSLKMLNKNQSSSKKGEIYNGVVYKAPVYDAPTYNFIYTAPINHPGFDLHHQNKSDTFAKEATTTSFTPLNFFNSWASSGSFPKPNLMPLTQANNDSLKQNFNYGKHTINKEESLMLTTPHIQLQNSISYNTHPVTGLPSSRPYTSPLPLSQRVSTPSTTVQPTENSTLLNEIINTLKTLTNQT